MCTRGWSGCTRSTTRCSISVTRPNPTGLRLPGRRTDPREDGSFDVDYDIPLVFFDVALDDGVTNHQDMHDGMGRTQRRATRASIRSGGARPSSSISRTTASSGICSRSTARRVRCCRWSVASTGSGSSMPRSLASTTFKLMSSTQGPKAARDLGYTGQEMQGQYRIPDGQQCMRFTEIATDGGLLPLPIPRDNFELWPAQRREVIIDFTKYQDGTTPTTPGDVVYLTNVMKMKNGRMWNSPHASHPTRRTRSRCSSSSSVTSRPSPTRA